MEQQKIYCMDACPQHYGNQRSSESLCYKVGRQHLNQASKTRQMFSVHNEEECHSREKKHPKQKHGGVRESGVFGDW